MKEGVWHITKTYDIHTYIAEFAFTVVSDSLIYWQQMDSVVGRKPAGRKPAGLKHLLINLYGKTYMVRHNVG